jgi:peptidyl-prolyl cis-trans isomerase C
VTQVFALLTVLAACGCSKGTPAASVNPSSGPAAAPVQAPAQTKAQTTPPATPPKAVPAQLPEVVARVNGEAIGKAEFESAVRNLEGRAGGQVPADQRDRVYRGVLDQLIAYRLLIQETKARKMAIFDADVDARVAEIKKQFPSEEAFKQTLAQQKMTEAQLREDAKADMLVTKMLEFEVKVSVPPQEVTAFYQQNPEKFQQGERARASHILIRLPEKADEKVKQEARAKAADVMKQVTSGQDFAALAKQHSQDPGSATNGGDLGYFQQGQMVGAFERAAFALKPGEVSDIVETPFGFHIIKLVDKQPARTVPIDEVRPQIEQFLQNQQRQTKTQSFVESLKTKGKVEILI